MATNHSTWSRREAETSERRPSADNSNLRTTCKEVSTQFIAFFHSGSSIHSCCCYLVWFEFWTRHWRRRATLHLRTPRRHLCLHLECSLCLRAPPRPKSEDKWHQELQCSTLENTTHEWCLSPQNTKSKLYPVLSPKNWLSELMLLNWSHVCR